MRTHGLSAGYLIAVMLAGLLMVHPPCAAQAARDGSPWSVIVAGEQTVAEQLATVDLQRYLAQVTGTVPRVMSVEQWQRERLPAVVLGTPRTNPLLEPLRDESQGLGEQGYYLTKLTLEATPLIAACGEQPAGAVNAVYGLLRELGFGFYLGSESAPQKLPDDILSKPIARTPALTRRGVLPWYNFFNSPTTWDPLDHRAFVDQLVRMGANFVGFHTYDHEPFAAYEETGRMQHGRRLLSTRSPTWGTHPLPTREFGYGIDQLFADDYFGAETTKLPDDELAIRREQEIMRDAIDYAHKRGLKTCMGFEPGGDPTNPEHREIFLKRLNHILDQYPSLDYVWLWQTETQGAIGFGVDTSDGVESALIAYAGARRPAFKRIVERERGEGAFLDRSESGKTARALEAARLEQYCQLAHRAMAQRADAPKLIVCGWGGDDRLLSAEYYEGLDKLLPRDVVFASLDHIVPRTRVDGIYHELPTTRQRWPIPWLEYDGDQWHPQPFVHVYEKMMRDIAQGGSQGALGIHWRTRDIEETFGFLVDYSWDTNLTAESFFKDLARRCYAPTIADEMAAIHIALDKLGYRWVGGAGQIECGSFGWGPGEAEKVAQLQTLRDRVVPLLDKSGPSRQRVQWLIDNVQWVLQFREAEVDAVKARDLITKAHSVQPDQAKALATEALALLDSDKLARAVRTYAQRVTTRGEYGVLATIQTKAVVAWRDLRQQCFKLLEREETAEPQFEWTTEPRIALPRLLASATEGEDVELMPIVFDGQPAWLHYRRLGEKQWTSKPMQNVRGWVRRATIPAAVVAQPGIEFAFSFASTPDQAMASGPTTVTVMPALKVRTEPPALLPAPLAKPLALTIQQTQVAPVSVTWEDVPGADYFRVYRDGQPVADTAVAFFPDTPLKPVATYKIEAWRRGHVIAASEPVQHRVPDHSIDGRVDVTAQVTRAAVSLRWADVNSPHAVRYRVRRAPADDPTSAELIGEIRVTGPGMGTRKDPRTPGRWIYTIHAVNAAGREFEIARSQPVEVTPLVVSTPVLDLPLTSRPDGPSIVGDVRFDSSGATFSGGHIALPHSRELDLGEAMTLTFDFRADSIDAMPVLLCHGSYGQDGWFVQILGGRLILRAAGGDALGPPIEPGKWYSVRFVYDGLRFHLWVNGEHLPQSPREIVPKPAMRNFYIGRYEEDASIYAFKGSIRNVKIYPDAVRQ